MILRLRLAALFECFLAGKVYSAAVVDLGDLDPGHVADVENVLDLLGALELKILDVAHAVLARSKLDECADGDDADDLAVVQRADLGLENDVFDGLTCRAACLDILGGDEDAANI